MTTPTLFKLPKRAPRRLVAIEFNPFQILAVEIGRRNGRVMLESAAEFSRDDTDGLRRWVDARDPSRKSPAGAICGLIPHRGIVHRENVEAGRLDEPGYVEALAEEQQRGRFLTATPFKIFNAKSWKLDVLSAVDGAALAPLPEPQPALICGIARDEIVAAQRRLEDSRLGCERLEPGLLSLFGAIYKNLERRGGSQAVVVVVIHQSATVAYILGKEGVHTPNPIMHGLDSVIEMGRKELGEIDERAVLAELQMANADLIKHGAKLVRRIGRDLKPVIDAFEMTTGQPVDEILCAYLPPGLSWIGEPLAQATGRNALAIDFDEWMPAVELQVAEGGPAFGPHWLGALSLVANLADPARTKRGDDAEPVYDRPWHIDCSIDAELDERKIATRRLLTATLAGLVAAFVLVVSGWQLYITYSLRRDTRQWEEKISENQKLFENLNAANATLQAKTAILDRAYELMGENGMLSSLLMNLGRTLPPRVRIDRIESNDTRVAITGSVLEPAEEAAITLGRHMDDIRRNSELGPLFSSIQLTSFQRKPSSDAVSFELTLRFRPLTP